MLGDSGEEFIHLGSGDDVALAGDDDDIVMGGSGDDIIDAGAGNDIVDAGTGDDAVEAGDGNDLIFGNLGNDNLSLGDGADVALGEAGNDTINGDAGNDILSGGDGLDILQGGSGADILSGDADDDMLTGDIGDDSLLGGAGNDTLLGGLDDDLLVGGEGDDTLEGNEGDDRLVSDAGSNSLLGGEGDDWYFAAQEATTTITDEDGTDDGIVFSWLDEADIGNLSLARVDDNLEISYNATLLVTVVDHFNGMAVETLEIAGGKTLDIGSLAGAAGPLATPSVDAASGTSQQSLLDIDLNALNTAITNAQNANDNQLINSLSDVAYEELLTESLEQEVFNGDEVMSFKRARGGCGGHYTVYKLDQITTLNGSEGDTVDAFYELEAGYDADDYDQVLTDIDKVTNDYAGNYQDGMNTIAANIEISDYVDGGDLVVTIATYTDAGTGDPLATIQLTEAEAEALSGETLAQRQAGGVTELVDAGLSVIRTGVDKLVGAWWGESINGASGDDIIAGNGGDDYLTGGAGNDWIFGGDGDDRAAGDGGYDIIFGGNGEDTLYGNSGNDVVIGGEGNDTLYGVTGDDYLAGKDGDDVIHGGAGDDRIDGGEGDDMLWGQQGDIQAYDYTQSYTLSQYNYGSPSNYTELTGDFNGDGYLDLTWMYSGTNGATAFYAFGDEDGSFTGVAGGNMYSGSFGQPEAYTELVGDVNGDGLDDLVWMYSGPNGASVFRALSNGTGFDALSGGNIETTSFGSYENYQEFVANIDADADGELVWVYSGPNGVTAYTATDDGDGNFDSVEGGTLWSANFGSIDNYEKRLGDINGDGSSDLLWVYSGSNGSTIYASLSDGNGGFGNVVGGNLNSTSMGSITDYDKRIADVNGDGNQDVVWMHSGTSGFKAYTALSDGDGTFTWSSGGVVSDGLSFTSTGTFETLTADVNGDGNDDLVFVANDSDNVGVYLSNGDGTYAEQFYGSLNLGTPVGASGWSAYTKLIGDANDDGVADLIWSYSGNDGLHTYVSLNQLSLYGGNNLIYGDGGNDQLYGGNEQDVLFGGEGDDLLHGGEGLDSLYGDAGNDVFVFNGTLDSPLAELDTIFDFAQGEDRIQFTNFATAASIIGTAAFSATGGTELRYDVVNGDSVYEMDVDGDGNADMGFVLSGQSLLLTQEDLFFEFTIAGDTITGTTGNDTLNGDYANDTITGNSGNDVIQGLGGNDTISGNAGDDALYGGIGNDLIYGDDGEDTINGGDGYDVLYGGGDDDQIYGGEGRDTLYGGLGNDTLEGQNGDDTIYGEDGDDHIEGDAGDDYLDGGDGDDYIRGDDGDDVIYGGAGNDNLNGYDGNDTIHGGDGNDIINGGKGNDSLYGDAGNDTIYASSHNDFIDGGTGDDEIWGGNGKDDIYLGDGLDTFVYYHQNDSTATATDVFYDFVQGDDTIRFDGFGLSTTLIGTAAFSVTGASELRYDVIGDDTKYVLDHNGDGVGDIYFLFNNQTLTLTQADLEFVA